MLHAARIRCLRSAVLSYISHANSGSARLHKLGCGLPHKAMLCYVSRAAVGYVTLSMQAVLRTPVLSYIA